MDYKPETGNILYSPKACILNKEWIQNENGITVQIQSAYSTQCGLFKTTWKKKTEIEKERERERRQSKKRRAGLSGPWDVCARFTEVYLWGELECKSKWNHVEFKQKKEKWKISSNMLKLLRTRCAYPLKWYKFTIWVIWIIKKSISLYCVNTKVCVCICVRFYGPFNSMLLFFPNIKTT